MHEVGIVEDLIESVRARIKSSENIGRVKKIYLRLGREMGIAQESLRFWFDNLSRGTELEGVDLKFSLVDGRELLVDSLEVE